VAGGGIPAETQGTFLALFEFIGSSVAGLDLRRIQPVRILFSLISEFDRGT
jgi:hypothetical protein